MARVEPHAVDRREAGVPQPDHMVQQRGRLIVRIGKPEVIPALVEEPLQEVRRVELLRLRARKRIPAVGGERTRCGVKRLENVGDEERARF